MPLNSPRRFRQFSAWALLLAQSALLAQDFRITEAVLNAAGRLELGFPAEATSYYRLIEGAAPEAVNRTVGLGLTPPLISPPSAGGASFFRVEQIARTASLDSDGDQIPDVYELTHPPLNGLNPADAGADPDGNGKSALQEYRDTIAPAVLKAAYVDIYASGAYAAIPSSGFSAPNIIIFAFADVSLSSMPSILVSSIEKAMSSASAGTLNLLSLGGEFADSSTFNSGTVNQIANNVISQINGFNSTHSTKIGGVDLDLEKGIDSATITSLAIAFKNAGFIVGAAPQIFISSGTGANIDSSNPSNLVLTSGANSAGIGANVNTYQAALNTGKIDYLFVQTYNSSGFTINNVDESNISFFKNSALALNNVVRTSCSSTSICIPASTKIVIGTVANKYAGGFTPFMNNATAADQQRTLNALLSDINSMVGNPAFSNIGGTMVWSQNMDYAASLYNSGNTAQTPGAFNTTIFGALPAPTVSNF